METIYTDHAKEKINERKIPKKLIRKSLKDPDNILNGRFGRKIAHKFIRNKLLRIVYEKQNGNFIIITAYYTSPRRYQS